LPANQSEAFTSEKPDRPPSAFAPKARTITVAICALVRLSSGRIFPSEPFSRPFATAFSSAAVDQLSGISENATVPAALPPAAEPVSAAYAAADIMPTSMAKTIRMETGILLRILFIAPSQ